MTLTGCAGPRIGTISESKFQQTYNKDRLSRFVELELQNSEPIRVHYQDEDEAPTLLLLHGVCDSLHTWDRWTEELKTDFRIVRLDYPPFGRLTDPFEQGAESELQWVEFLDAFLDQLGILSTYVAGNSLGGGIAWRFAKVARSASDFEDDHLRKHRAHATAAGSCEIGKGRTRVPVRGPSIPSLKRSADPLTRT